MNKLALTDILPTRVYETVRDDLRKKVIAVKIDRRFSVGDNVTMVFENRATMIFQVQEMVRAEQITEPARIQDELNVYNELLPDAGELAATLFVEVTEQSKIRDVMGRLVGLDTHVMLAIGEHRIRAKFEEGRSEEDRISSVQYLRFVLGNDAQSALRTPGTRVAVVIDHPRYHHTRELDESARASLAADLD